MYTIFDTETTGFPNKFLPPSASNQARIMQFAALQLDDDFNPVAEIKAMIKPDGWSIVNEGAFKAHGLTHEMCVKRGAPMKAVLDVFFAMFNSSSIVVAHNIIFDKQMIDIESEYHKHSCRVQQTNLTKLFCTMIYSTDICKLPSKFPGKYKWPKVKEAYKHFTGEEPDNQHDAMGDVRATAVIFRKLFEAGIVKNALAL